MAHMVNWTFVLPLYEDGASQAIGATMLSRPFLVGVFASILIYALIQRRSSTYQGGSSLDWAFPSPVVGVDQGWFPWVRANIRSFSDSKIWAYEGYSKYSKVNSPFIIPTLDRGPVVVVPPKQIKKVYGHPTNVLDVYVTQNETIQSGYTIHDQGILQKPFHLDVIRHQMTRNLEHLTPIISAELNQAFDKWWGRNEIEWTELSIWNSCLKLIAGAANGAFCGPPLCRNAVFLNRLRDHAMSVFVGAMIIGATPSVLRPLVGRIVGLHCEFRFRRTLRICLPLVKERLENTARAKNDTSFRWDPPQDGLQWVIDESYAAEDAAAQLEPVRVARRLLYLNDISLHSTSFTIQNVILDVFNAEDSDTIVEALREECSTVLQEAGGSWTRAAVQKLSLVDSTIRESMRLTPFASVGLPRTVIQDGVVTLETSKGHVTAPRGTVLAAPMDPVHRDESIYPEANKFDPFRFVRSGGVRNIFEAFDPEEKRESRADQPRILDSNEASKPKSAATLDSAFLGFGFGKHACPGRFFALNEMKVFLAHVVLNYDVRCLDRRPELTSILWLKVPYNDGRVRVRRRASPAS